LIDFLNNFHQSAKANLPIYKLSGSEGFAWIANYNFSRYSGGAPSPSTYVCVAMKSSGAIVFERVKVSTTSAGMLTRQPRCQRSRPALSCH
jgi:hypothetical protein